MIDISILKMKIFFFISKLHITASFKYLSSSFLVSFKIFSSLHHYSILLTILPNCAGPILPPAPLQQCRRLNFYKEVEDFFRSRDRDFDGFLSFEEFLGEESKLEKLFKRMDKNNDGKVSKQVK